MNQHKPDPEGKPLSTPSGDGEVLEVISLIQMARICRVTPDWLDARVASGLVHAQRSADDAGAGPVRTRETLRFHTSTVTRVRRMARLEETFDADPELAAMTTDLIEEVMQLRTQVRMLMAVPMSRAAADAAARDATVHDMNQATTGINADDSRT